MIDTLNFDSKVVFLNGLPLTLPIASSDPGTAEQGDLYYNSISNTIRYYNGSSWTNTGAVQSVALADGDSTSIFGFTGSPITSSGTIDIYLQNQNSGLVLASPATGPAAQPSFRVLVATDIPSLAYANQALSNLSTTAINTSLLPGTTNAYNIGNSSTYWSNVYTETLPNSGDGNTAISIINRTLVDTSGTISVWWAARELVDTSGNSQLSWSTSGISINALLLNGSTSGTLTQQASATTTSYSLTWPTAQATGTQALINNGSGVLSWSSISINAINQLTGDVTAGPAVGSQSEAATVAAIQGTTVSGTTGTGNVAFSDSPTFTGIITAGSLSATGTGTFGQYLTITNDMAASSITTGNPSVAGLSIQGTNVSSNSPFSPSITNLQSGTSYSMGNILFRASSTWIQGANTAESFTGAGYTQWTVDSNADSGWVCGLSTVLISGYPTLNQVDFGLGALAGAYYIYENGTQVAGPFGTITAGDILKVQRAGTNINYIVNGSTIYTHSSVSSSSALYGGYAASGNISATQINDVLLQYEAVFVFSLTNAQSMTSLSSGNILFGASGTNWNQGANSAQSFVGNGYTQWTVDPSANEGWMCGLSAHPIAIPNTYTSIDYSLFAIGGSYYIYEGGNQIGGTYGGSVTAGDVLKVQRSGTNILYIINGVTVYTHTGVSPSSALFGAYSADNTGGATEVDSVSLECGVIIPQNADLLSTQDGYGNPLFSLDAFGNVNVNASIKNSTPKTTLTGSAGTAICSQPEQGSSYKLVIVYLNRYTDTGTQTFTYPTAFINTPYVYGTTGGVAGASASTTSVTFTVTSQTGFVFIQGY